MTPCAKCKEPKAPDDFIGGTRRASGDPYWCRACVRAYQQAWRAKKPIGYFRQSQTDKLAQPAYRPRALLEAARKRARLKNLDFDLSMAWVKDRLRAGRCEVTGLPFDLTVGERLAGKRRAVPVYRPTIDRRDPAKGYTTDNCQVVIWAYNVAKFDFGHDALVTWITAWMAAKGNLEGIYSQQPKVMGDDGSG